MTQTADLPTGAEQITRNRPSGSTDSANAPRNPPIVALASPYGGASRLSSLLSDHPELACTSGTGLLPLCEQVMATWHKADGRDDGPPSRLAITATRALTTSVIISVLAKEGKQRWCEFAAANAPAAETFLRLFPGTRFLCLHRACPGVIRAALDASPWGIADPIFAPFTRAFPTSTIAALTAYWVAHTQALLKFEFAHPEACLRVRFEDLEGTEYETVQEVLAFLGISTTNRQPAPGERNRQQATRKYSDPEAVLPVELIPPGMLAQANDLLRQLGYPVLPAPVAK